MTQVSNQIASFHIIFLHSLYAAIALMHRFGAVSGDRFREIELPELRERHSESSCFYVESPSKWPNICSIVDISCEW
jgi:hypothetical protein